MKQEKSKNKVKGKRERRIKEMDKGIQGNYINDERIHKERIRENEKRG